MARWFILLLIVAGAFAAGVIFGLRIAPQPTRDQSRYYDQRTITQLQKDNAELRRALAGTRKEAAATPESAGSGGTEIRPLADEPPWRLAAALRQRHLPPDAGPVLGRDGKLSPVFAEFYGLTPAETDALQRSLDTARESLANLERTNSSISRDDKGNIVISVNPFPTAGGAVYDALLASVAQTLGPERNAAFSASSTDELERELKGFGAEQRTVKIGYDATGNGYSVTDSFTNGAMRGSSTSQFRNMNDVVSNLGTVGRLLEPETGKTPP